MANRRVSRRIPFRTRVNYGLSKPQFSGYTSNISEGGIRIECGKVFPRNSKITIAIYTDGIELEGAAMDQTIMLTGIVTWVSPVLPGVRSKMGIKILNPDNDFTSLYQRKLNQYSSGSQTHLAVANS